MQKRIASLTKKITEMTQERTALQAKLDALLANTGNATSSYALTDVLKITSRYVDPNAQVADEEYTQYRVTLNSGKRIAVRVFVRTIQGMSEKAFRDSGYTGDVPALIAKAVVLD